MNNLDKKSLRLMIPEELLTDAELDSYKYISGIYGYIILCLSIIPDKTTKVLFIRRLRMAITLNGLLTSNLKDVGQSIRDTYYKGVNLPSDFQERLRLYSQRIINELQNRDESH